MAAGDWWLVAPGSLLSAHGPCLVDVGGGWWVLMVGGGGWRWVVIFDAPNRDSVGRQNEVHGLGVGPICLLLGGGR